MHHGGGTIAPGTTVLQLAARIANCSTIYFKTGHYRSRRRAPDAGLAALPSPRGFTSRVVKFRSENAAGDSERAFDRICRGRNVGTPARLCREQ